MGRPLVWPCLLVSLDSLDNSKWGWCLYQSPRLFVIGVLEYKGPRENWSATWTLSYVPLLFWLSRYRWLVDCLRFPNTYQNNPQPSKRRRRSRRRRCWTRQSIRICSREQWSVTIRSYTGRDFEQSFAGICRWESKERREDCKIWWFQARLSRGKGDFVGL